MPHAADLSSRQPDGTAVAPLLPMKTYTVELHRSPTEARRRCEVELAAAGTPVPPTYLCEWIALTEQPRWLLSAHDTTGRCRAAMGIEERPSRAMPGHVSLRADDIVASGGVEAIEALLIELPRLGVAAPVLRIDAALRHADDEVREALGGLLASWGFVRVDAPEAYTHTSLVDLTEDEDTILAGFHATARRHIRAAERKPVDLRPIDDPRHGAAMEALLDETFARTGGPKKDRHCESLVEMSRRAPQAAHAVGMFDPDTGRMLSFACAHREGRRARYAEAASTRDTPVNVPLGYAPLWELMRWAKRTGATTFDLGGITTGDHDSEDPLGGISDFKRYFRGNVTEIGSEWAYEPRPARATWVRIVHRIAEWGRARWREPIPTEQVDAARVAMIEVRQRFKNLA